MQGNTTPQLPFTFIKLKLINTIQSDEIEIKVQQPLKSGLKTTKFSSSKLIGILIIRLLSEALASVDH